jgi:hypothetical protein
VKEKAKGSVSLDVVRSGDTQKDEPGPIRPYHHVVVIRYGGANVLRTPRPRHVFRQRRPPTLSTHRE